VILPRKNMQDLTDIPADLKRRMTFVPVDHMEDVIEAALEATPLRDRRGLAARSGVLPAPPVAAAESRQT
jgi:ATP-dependent Lon protease